MDHLNLDNLHDRVMSLEREKGVTLADAFQGAHLAGKTYQRGRYRAAQLPHVVGTGGRQQRPGDASDWRELLLAGGR